MSSPAGYISADGSEPRSVKAKSGYDRQLRERMNKNRAQAAADWKNFDRWARQGCMSNGVREIR